MKKMIITLAITIFTGNIFAQMQKIVSTSDSSLTIDNIYLGALSSIDFSTQDMSFASPYSLRAAAMVTWRANNWINIKTFSVYERVNEKDLINNQFYLNLKLTQNWSLDLGKMATPATEIRPLPPTADSHFETWTEAQMPGSALGAKIGHKNSWGNLKIGIAARNKKAEFSAHLSTTLHGHEIHAVGMIGGTKATNYLVGLTHKYSRLYQVAVFKQAFNPESLTSEQIIGYFVNYKISSTKKLDFYVDSGYSLSKKNFPRLEGGFIKSFENGIFKGLIALGYVQETPTTEEIRAIKAYLFVHL